MEQAESQQVTKRCSFTFSQLKELNIEKPAPIIDGLLFARQNGMLAGQFAVGKTFLSLQMSLCLAAGKDFLGRKVKQSRVVFIDGENDTGDIKHRVLSQAAALGIEDFPDDQWVYATTKELDTNLANVSLTESHSLKALDEFLTATSPDVLFLDNLGWFWPGDLENAGHVQSFYQTLRKLRDKHESLREGSIVFLHHLTKPGERHGWNAGVSLLENPHDFLYQARGSARLLDFAEARLGLGWEDTGTEKYVVLNGINRSAAEIVPLMMSHNPETLCFDLHEDKRLIQEKVFKKHQAKLDLFNRLPVEFSFGDAEKFHKTKATVRDTLRIARQAGLIEKLPNGRYRKFENPVNLLDPVDQEVVH